MNNRIVEYGTGSSGKGRVGRLLMSCILQLLGHCQERGGVNVESGKARICVQESSLKMFTLPMHLYI